MGLIAAVIIAIVGYVLASFLNTVPADTMAKFIPLCWIPGADCANRYANFKMYILVTILVLILWVIPF